MVKSQPLRYHFNKYLTSAAPKGEDNDEKYEEYAGTISMKNTQRKHKIDLQKVQHQMYEIKQILGVSKSKFRVL